MSRDQRFQPGHYSLGEDRILFTGPRLKVRLSMIAHWSLPSPPPTISDSDGGEVGDDAVQAPQLSSGRH